MNEWVIGVDLGGTKIEAIALDDGMTERFRKRISTPKSYPDRITAIATLVDEARMAAGATCTVGIGTPGAVSPHSGRMQNAENLTGETLLDLCMRCGNCSDAVTAALKGVDGVNEAAVSHSDGVARVAFDGSKTNVDKLIATINALGKYKAEKPKG